MAKVILCSCLLLGLVIEFSYCWVINDINLRVLADDVLSNGTSDDEVDSNSRINQRINLIFPGTKWCGAGNVADNYDDLGAEIEADMCCREHDNCPDFIPGGGTKNNLTNEAFYTRLNCECDDKFRGCLRAAGTKTAKRIGVIYFNALQTKCYREDYLAHKCIKKGGWFKRKCVAYTYDTNGQKKYQWFDVNDY